MAEDEGNPLDDELLKELGLEPTGPAPREVPPAPRPAAAKPAVPRGPSAPVGPPGLGRGVPPPRKPGVPETKPPAPSASARPASVAATPAQSDEQFQQSLSRLSEDMPVQVVAVLGKRTMTLKDVIGLKQGEIIELKKLPQDTVDLVANGKLMARGELVLVDGKLGIQIKQLVG